MKVVRFQGGCIRPLCHRSVSQVSDLAVIVHRPNRVRSADPALDSQAEKCQSGRMGRPAKALIAVTRSVGSNPTFSAIVSDRRAVWCGGRFASGDLRRAGAV